ncbi:MAG: hypothetical protein K0B87_03230 [Candidatus Syntrophosphaera sp.]|nr:hypothetical protein [Candidatus Syntrophosphaera sp.]
MKLLSASVFCLLFSLLQALDFVPGSGEQVVGPDREYSFAYHTGTDDYRFFGSDVWAVRFDFSEVYPNLDTSEFAVTKALLFLPQTVDSVRVELFTDLMGFPGSSLTWAKVAVTSNHLEIPFPVTVQNDSLWLVVTYPTNFSNRFVSASAGGGSRSYYWNTNVPNPYFQSLAAAGYSAELLFGLGGDFVLSGMDLELMHFDLEGILEPRAIVAPAFRIYNHSDLPITDAVVNMNVYSPDPQFAFFDPISITETIAPRSMYEFNAQSPGYEDHRFELPGTPLQLKLRAALSSSYQASDPQYNNVILIHRFSFEHPYPAYLAENFLRADNSDQITFTQDQYSFPDIHNLNYFPILSDPLGNIAAQIRFNWFGFNSLPRTAINGDLRINGFSTAYGDQFDQLCQDAQTQKSFVSGSECRFAYQEQTDILTATIVLSNDDTRLYTAATEYNLVANTRLCVGLFQRVSFDGSDRYVISRWISHGQSLPGPLGMGESLTLDLNIPLNNLSLNELSQSYRLYYWLQLAGGGKILYSAWTDFSGIVSNQEELLPAPRLLVSSNPLRQEGIMRIKMTDGTSLRGLRIYNIRGQLVLESQAPDSEILLTAGQFPASGIYLLCLPVVKADGSKTELKAKINIIK